MDPMGLLWSFFMCGYFHPWKLTPSLQVHGWKLEDDDVFPFKTFFFGGGGQEFVNSSGVEFVFWMFWASKKNKVVLNLGGTWQKWKCSSPQPHHHNVPQLSSNTYGGWQCVFSDGFLPMEDSPMFCGGKPKDFCQETVTGAVWPLAAGLTFALSWRCV